jgi:hypothetical protein
MIADDTKDKTIDVDVALVSNQGRGVEKIRYRIRRVCADLARPISSDRAIVFVLNISDWRSPVALEVYCERKMRLSTEMTGDASKQSSCRYPRATDRTKDIKDRKDPANGIHKSFSLHLRLCCCLVGSAE